MIFPQNISGPPRNQKIILALVGYEPSFICSKVGNFLQRLSLCLLWYFFTVF